MMILQLIKEEDVAEVLAQCKGGGSDAKLIDVMRKVIMGEE